MGTIKPVHASIKGRTRFLVHGLYRDEALKNHLEKALDAAEGVTSVSASVLTGKILVFHNAAKSPADIAGLISANLLSLDKALQRSGPSSSLRRRSAQNKRQHEVAQRNRPGKALASKRKFRKMVVQAEKQQVLAWYAEDGDAVLQGFETQRLTGLSGMLAQKLLEKYGPNVLPESVPRSGFSIFIEQLKSAPVALLTAAAGISVATGGLADAVAIMAVVGINAVIGYATESQSEKIIHSLKSLVQPRARVVRDGDIRELDAKQVVPGDLLVLRPGDYVAADARLLEANRLSIDESALTGESMPVSKTTTRLKNTDIPLSDRVNMCYMGTLITGGQGLAVVVATGRFTEMGQIQSLIGESKPPETPMARQLDQMGARLVIVSGALCGIVFVLGILRGYGLLRMLKTAISLAVAAVPEGLPAVATTTLALGIREMRRHGVLIRHLNAIEALGAAQVICLDKTGTITENRMSIVTILAGSRRVRMAPDDFSSCTGSGTADFREEFSGLLVTASLCNESEPAKTAAGFIVNGTPTENALIRMALGCGFDVIRLRESFPRVRVIHRSEQRNFMVTMHRVGKNRSLLAVKGSPTEVMALCSRRMEDGQIHGLETEDRMAIQTENERMAGNALRVLAFAYAHLGDDESAELDDEKILATGLIWLGLVGMADPIRRGVKRLVADFHRAGVKTVMITGDQSPTAFTVGKALELNGDGKLRILDSTGLANLDQETMQALCQQTNVFSRVSPANKLQIVQAIQGAGKVVAMTGDGINDGPALKAADIGVAMGHTGTDVAREVADVVLENDSLETMLIAIQEGRTIYANVRKALRFLLSTNLSEIMVTFTANVGGLGQPLTEMQLLWINLVTDIFPGLALSLEQPEKDVLARPPRDPRDPIISSADLKKIAREAGVISAGAMGSYGYGLARYGIGPRAGTMAFLSLTMGQLFHAISCRSETHSMYDPEKLPPNPSLKMALAGSLSLQALTLTIPGLRSLLGISALGFADLLVIGGSSVLPLLANEAVKKNTKGTNT